MRNLIFILILLLTVSCSPPEKEPKGSDLVSGVDKKYTIVTIVKIDGIAWFSRMREGVQKFAEETGHNSFLTGPPEAKGQLQIEFIEKAIRDKVDAICIVPFDLEAIEPVLKKAREKGIVVIAHEASNTRNADYIIEAFSNEEYGAHFMDLLAKNMNYKGEYVAFIGNKGSTTHIEWMTAAANRQKEKYPEISLYGNWLESSDDHAITYSLFMENLKENPNINGVLGGPASTPAGVGLAVEQLGKAHDIAVVSTSLVSVCAPYLENGSVDVISYWDPAQAGYVMNLMAVMALEQMEIKDGMDLFVHGYNNIAADKENKKLFYGSAWQDVTKENMNEHAF